MRVCFNVRVVTWLGVMPRGLRIRAGRMTPRSVSASGWFVTVGSHESIGFETSFAGSDLRVQPRFTASGIGLNPSRFQPRKLVLRHLLLSTIVLW